MAALGSLSSLLGNSSIDDHEENLKAANLALSKSGKDVEAQHVKVVALLKLDRFEEALRTLEHGGDTLKERARLEWAYALYKAGQPGKAAEVARRDGGDDDRGMRHIEAQASYRHEDFERAARLFEQLAAGSAGVANEEMDLRINNGAVKAQLEWSGLGYLVKEKKPQREDLEAFETAYNAACGSIARDELGQAEVLLRRSKDLCNALEDLSIEEKQAEILPITVQQIYVLIRQGRLDDASSLASELDIKSITESSTHHAAETNVTAASSEPINPYLSHRILHKSPDTIKPDVPFTYQSAAMRRNNYALDLLSQKYSGIITSTTSAITKHPSPTLDANVNSLAAFNAAAHAKSQPGRLALKAILPVLDRRPTDIGLLLVVIQLYVQSGNHGAAITLLESFFTRLEESTSDAKDASSNKDVRYAPALTAILVALYTARGQTTHARSALSKAATYWLHRSKDSSSSLPPRSLTHLYKAAGTALLTSDHPADHTQAAHLFTHLNTLNPKDPYTTAGLVASFASTDPQALSPSLLATLPSLQTLIPSIDINALEAAGIPKLPVPTTSSTNNNKKRPADTSSAPKKQKKMRKSHMPKDFDPNKKMDPERWLPVRDRSYYRPAKGSDKKKLKAKQAMLMQGGAVEEGSRESSRPGTPGVGAGEVLKAGSGPGGNKKGKKKGKGGKW